MEDSVDTAKLTDTTRLRVHELQEGYQSIIVKVSISLSSRRMSLLIASSQRYHQGCDICQDAAVIAVWTRNPGKLPNSPDWRWVQIDRLAADGTAHFDAAKERLAQDVKR